MVNACLQLRKRTGACSFGEIKPSSVALTRKAFLSFCTNIICSMVGLTAGAETRGTDQDYNQLCRHATIPAQSYSPCLIITLALIKLINQMHQT
jgi:hypothetical protein